MEELQDDPAYVGWELYTHGRVKLLHPPDHIHEPRLDAICEGYLSAADHISGKLGLPPFEDSLLIVLYTGFGQGRELTGVSYPFIRDGVIHYWQPSYTGTSLTDFLLPRWSQVEPDGRLVWHGIRTLFDLSGYNYHAETQQLINRGQFIPLADLAVDEFMASDSERTQSAEAASLVAYIMAQYGNDGLRLLYESPVSFEESVEQQFGVSVDSLQEEWLRFVRAALEPSDASGR